MKFNVYHTTDPTRFIQTVEAPSAKEAIEMTRGPKNGPGAGHSPIVEEALPYHLRRQPRIYNDE